MKINIHNSGKYYEYKALDLLKNEGYKVARIPVSGSGKQPLPDIIATKDGVIFAIEVKSTSKLSKKIDKFQIDKLFNFCEMFNFCNCKPAVLVYFKKTKKWKFKIVGKDDEVIINA
ncbi:putative Holliday junction resolvase [Saccharolobus solfataricus rod-shaped virus 1]|uniref:Putative Holliday junction resolvase n=1 Tax=Saccharolobus solfataricus rod-shaped virus 1 TaxID=2730619 RepID=A0A6M3VYZ0_SSRV1|nr:putative Holliday junction resolvase [Saccharolobus solfataricus rod-shaped virus 1]QJF12295.1 putative Holliday junction resolvase [Saccharolobus solfataricus rod-shaped virus 1]